MPEFGFIQDVVMDKSSDMYKFNNDGQCNVFFPDAASRAACQ